MSRWFRVYGDLIDDPKFIKLGADLRGALLMVWCVASKNGGRIPELEDTAIKFRMTVARTQKLLDELERCGFIDRDEAGLTPHNWNGRQYRSDVSTDRVRRFRKRRETVSETPPDSTESDSTESESTEQKDISSLRSGGWPKDFRERFWAIYPRKVGKGAALRKLEAIRKRGEVPFDRLISAISKIEASEPQFIPHPLTWLNQGRYFDSVSTTGPPQPYRPNDPNLPTHEQLKEKYGSQRRKVAGTSPESSGLLAEGAEFCGEQADRVGVDRAGNGAIRQLGAVLPVEGVDTICDQGDSESKDTRDDHAD